MAHIRADWAAADAVLQVQTLSLPAQTDSVAAVAEIITITAETQTGDLAL